MQCLKGEDNSYLAWENPARPQVTINAVVLDPTQGRKPVTFDTVNAAVPASVAHVEPLQWPLSMPRLRFGRPWWISRPRIDIDYHVKKATAGVPAGDRELAATISAIVDTATDRSRPLRQLWYVDGLSGGHVAFVLKIHHGVADGMSSLHLLETICSTDPDAPLPALFRLYARALPLVAERFTNRPTFSLIASNVRGPQRRLCWAGAPIEKLTSTGPLVFPMGLNFTGWSYGDQMTIGVLGCGQHVADSWDIADGTPKELAELTDRAAAMASTSSRVHS